MDMSQVAANAGGVFSSIFLIATYTMTTMIPLRIFGILTNLVLITFSFTTGNYATMILHMVLLPLNSYRLHQMLQLVRDVKKSVNSDLSMAWLKPFMTERQCQAGEVLFYKDEKAEEMFYIVSGRYRLVEMGMELPDRHAGRRNGHAVAEQQAHRHARMHRERPDSRRHLSPGRGAVRAEPRVRLLFPAAGERAAVRESRIARRRGSRSSPLRRRRRPRTSRPEPRGRPICSNRFGRWPTGCLARMTITFRRCRRVCRPILRRRSASMCGCWSNSRTPNMRCCISIGSAAFTTVEASASALFREIADLLAARMSFNDPIRVAQIVLGRAPLADPETSTIDPPNNLYRPEMQEFVAMFPRDQAEMIADGLTCMKMLRGRMRILLDRAMGPREAAAVSAVSGAFVRASLRYAKENSVHRTLAAHDRSRADQAAGRGRWKWCARSVSFPATAPATASRSQLESDRQQAGQAGVRWRAGAAATSRGACARTQRSNCRRHRRGIASNHCRHPSDCRQFDGCARHALILIASGGGLHYDGASFVISLIECKRGISE